MNLQLHYQQPTTQTKIVEVSGKSFTICKLPATEAVKMTMKLVKIGTPIISLFSKKESVELSDINFDDEEVSNMLIKIVGMCQIDGRMVLFDNDMTSFEMPFLLAFEFLKYNFSDFFQSSPLFKTASEKLNGLDLSKMKKEK